MPVHDFECPACGLIVKDRLHGVTEEVACEGCGEKMGKLIGLPFFHWGPGVKPCHESDRAKRNLEHPSIVKGLKEGRYEIAKAEDLVPWRGASSSILARAEEGSL